MTRNRFGIIFLALGCSIVGMAQTAANLTPPVLLMPVCSGLRELAGVTPLKLGRVQVAVNGRDVGERTVTTGQFALSIPPLKVNQFVEVTFRYKDSLAKERSLRSTFDVSEDGVCKPAEPVKKKEELKAPEKKPRKKETKEEESKEEAKADAKEKESKAAKAVTDALSPVTIKALMAGAKKITGTTPVKEGKVTAAVGGVETKAIEVKDAKFEINLAAADSTIKGLKENQEVLVTFTYETDGTKGKLTAKATVGPAPYTLQLLKEVVDRKRGNASQVCNAGESGCTKLDELTVTVQKDGVPCNCGNGNGVVESYSLNPDGEKNELLQAQGITLAAGKAAKTFEASAPTA